MSSGVRGLKGNQAPLSPAPGAKADELRRSQEVMEATLCDLNRQAGRARGGGGGGECLGRSSCELWRGRLGHVPAD